MKLNLAFAVLLSGMLLYNIYVGKSMTNGSMSITIGLIVLNLIFFITKYRKNQHEKMKDQVSRNHR
ncbi:hypothetical protein P4V43_13095 [Brevibacillus fortis]|uniref:Uncharacterized protein n=1 Tax=Brevibacillus fortis TaxID=2126352 RepID=A0A2P7VEE4_9BACL|nr:hypothetical protein [Brevibacillus fortis]MED1782751.1 hypothetical protein [Brevibacillus fortis]PSJ97520.1 hypothetical protein C7R93_07790 [Brevibacillus fortis]